MKSLNNLVTLKTGEKGRIVGKLEDGSYLLQYGRGGKLMSFTNGDILQ